jgi:hypothetical protein
LYLLPKSWSAGIHLSLSDGYVEIDLAALKKQNGTKVPVE